MRYGLIWQSMASSARRVSAVSDRRSKALHEDQANLPVLARFALHGLVAQLRSIEVDIEKIEAEILKWHRTNETSRRLATIPGIGPITASAIRRECARRVAVPIRSAIRGLAGTDAEVP
jgi:transposase